MSLLIPSKVDYDDAHPATNHFQEYATLLGQQPREDFSWKFEVVPGFFMQAEESTDDLKFRYTEQHFGLMLESWSELIKQVHALNEFAADNECYKVLFLARHGQGFHNFAVGKYGLPEWNRKWRHLTTDGEIVWGPDPYLTERGVNQALENRDAWKNELSVGCPLPQKFYSSPFTRSAMTLVNTWNEILDLKRVAPMIKENLRETIGVNRCDQRSDKKTIEKRYANQYGFQFEPGFHEIDDYFTEEWRESIGEQTLRINRFLQFLFDLDWNSEEGKAKNRRDSTFVSCTSHAGTIRSFLQVLGHREFTVGTGAMIPVVVKGIRHFN
ncbi:Putative phosphomutase [Komagataella phaffii CBS 7435]|uniref:Phosphomutase, contains a region homologous to the active site of phosphomutases n=2 Tax=Komagataella phaffii TaxID=460519 RepID=C4R823_KOMPG|nr:uncharacterized protein PAS_chr4_0493 [Komagataella phaffii GS115]AOA64938.1 GQ67_04858T0 [Komagataella phaffii]CAH2450861.1 Putative phosphomutase [Komagataella phaffii CBS 7435]AOA69640.1 GQ68_04830T0 [Komagataella phaffii GS115]CAY71748.1 Putative phosphomutase, contains a region homologous to the active site of phosphomutases [Komagataella phaffii GS115]SCV12373.1 Putative phosphomutase [Komagataella phaffii CBS 7435]